MWVWVVEPPLRRGRRRVCMCVWAAGWSTSVRLSACVGVRVYEGTGVTRDRSLACEPTVAFSGWLAVCGSWWHLWRESRLFLCFLFLHLYLVPSPPWHGGLSFSHVPPRCRAPLFPPLARASRLSALDTAPPPAAHTGDVGSLPCDPLCASSKQYIYVPDGVNLRGSARRLRLYGLRCVSLSSS